MFSILIHKQVNLVKFMDYKQRVMRMSRGIFILLSIGTLPILFINPAQYLFGLLICGGLAFGLANILV